MQTLQSDDDSTLRFFVVAHPDQLRDRTQMRKNRKHVMHNYLDKEAKKPNSKDSRVRKQKPQQTQSTTDLSVPDSGVERLRVASTSSRNRPQDDPDPEHCRRIRKVPRKSGYSKVSRSARPADRPNQAQLDSAPLVPGLGGRYENSAFMVANSSDIPFPDGNRSRACRQMPQDDELAAESSRSPFGADVGPMVGASSIAGLLEPFEAWPQFDNTSLGVQELKFSCSQRFGSKSLTMHWIPTMLKARHAFLSCLCISSSHDDIMRRNLLPHDKKTAESLMKRLQIRQAVISMINESLDDPELRIADSTIIAVLQILNSEVMGCDDRSLRVHQVGLHEMVRERGGLQALGLGGQLASVLTITMFLLAALRETSPHSDFVSYASNEGPTGPDDMARYPESPIYCRNSGFDAIKTVLPLEGDTYQLVELLRAVTEQFHVVNAPAPCGPSQVNRSSDVPFGDLSRKVFAMSPAWEQDFLSMNDRYTYESLRLTGMVYTYALTYKVPFSQAAAELGSSKTRPPYAVFPDSTIPVPIMIKNALMRTDTSQCWDHLAGVLFFAALIGAASANPGPLANNEREGEDEDARKWLTAIAVRCCIVLSFEYGPAVLGTLKQFLVLQSLLRPLGAQDSINTSEKSTPRITWTELDFISVEPASSTHRGFADSAQEHIRPE